MTSTSASRPGTLYIVATPIGHRNDISLRAIDTLKSVDTILAEDTRHSAPLLHFLGIQKPLLSLHAYNEDAQSEIIIDALRHGQSFALISDAGTPLISDPGYPLVKRARAQGIDVVPIPGPCALIAALSAAGIPCDTFTFYGFLPAKSVARLEALHAMVRVPHTVVFYESTHRLLACLLDVMTVFGATCPMVVAKELTKHFECFQSDTVARVHAWLMEEPARCKGEFVVMIPPRPVENKPHEAEHLLQTLLTEVSVKQAVKIAGALTSLAKNELYEMALRLKI